MDSTMTITQWDVLNSNRESAKPAKLSQEKIDNIGKKYRAKNKETAEKLGTVGYTDAYKNFLDKMNMQIANYGHAVVRLQGARKIKIVPKLKDQTGKFRDASDEKANQVSNDVNNNVVASIPQQEEVSNIMPFNTSKVLATPEYNRSENVSKEPVSNVNNMYSFTTGKPIVETRNEVNTQATPSVNPVTSTVNSNLSRTARMDYNTGVMAKEEPKEVKQTPAHPEFSSISEYVQQKNAATTNNSTNNTVDFIAEIAKRKKKIESLANKTNQVKGDTAERLKKFNEILSYYDNMVSDAEKKYSEAEQENIEVTQAYDNLVSQVEDYAATRGIAM